MKCVPNFGFDENGTFNFGQNKLTKNVISNGSRATSNTHCSNVSKTAFRLKRVLYLRVGASFSRILTFTVNIIMYYPYPSVQTCRQFCIFILQGGLPEKKDTISNT